MILNEFTMCAVRSNLEAVATTDTKCVFSLEIKAAASCTRFRSNSKASQTK